jgi:hypothetical protein
MEKITPFFPRSQATPSKKAKKTPYYWERLLLVGAVKKLNPFSLIKALPLFVLACSIFFPILINLYKKVLP